MNQFVCLFPQQTSEQWKWVFLISAAMLGVCGLIYVLFSKAELQPWNTPQPENADDEAEQLRKPATNVKHTTAIT